MTYEDALTQEITAAYYDDEITVDQLTVLVGAEAAANLWVVNFPTLLAFGELRVGLCVNSASNPSG